MDASEEERDYFADAPEWLEVKKVEKLELGSEMIRSMAAAAIWDRSPVPESGEIVGDVW
jgi:hypothetical protein